MLNAPEEFRTQNLLLRFPVIEDAVSIYEEYARDAEVTRYLMWEPHESVDTVHRYLADLIERCRVGRKFAWALTLPQDRNAMGMIEARVQGHMADLGYVLARKYWSRGYMTESISAVTEWLLRQSGIFRVWAVCDIDNIASSRALERSQFEREGVLRRWMVHPHLSAEPRDCYVYSRVRS